MVCGQKTEVYSRIVGYYRPVSQWNVGKQEEFKGRLPFTGNGEFVSDGNKEAEN